MEKRTILAIGLCLAVWMIWQQFFIDPQSFKPTQTDGGSPVATSAEADKTSPDLGARDPSSKRKIEATPTGERPGEKIAVIETDEFRVELSTRGASVKSLTLKAYKERQEGKPMDKLLAEDLVSLSEERGQPYAIRFREEKTDFDFPSYSDWNLLSQSEDQVSFTYDHPVEPVTITKTYRKTDMAFVLDLDVELSNRGEGSLREQMLLDMHAAYQHIETSGCMGAPAAPRTPMCMANGELQNIEAKAGLNASLEPNIMWTGINEQYFLMAGIPLGVEASVCKMVTGNDNIMTASLMMPAADIAPGGSVVHKFRLFNGPKRLDYLENIKGGTGANEQNAQLNASVDFGWFSVLCHPMLWLLKMFYNLVGNYGIAIIFLTILVKIILLPLNQKSMKSMKAMSSIKPLMDDLKKRCGDDKQKMNQEMMALYKTHNINPMGGCFPMLLQMPIWIALYRMLYSSVELYQTPFIRGWIDDMSYRDPYFIMPVVLGATMFLQQKMTPTSADSQQAKMMMYTMPIFFTFIMLYLPAGLVLYIFVNSLLAIAHQVVYNRMTEPKKAPA